MCFGGGDEQKEPEPVVPDSPPETLDQEAPEKKTANEKKTNRLSIGTKKYRTTNPAAVASGGYPSVSQ